MRSEVSALRERDIPFKQLPKCRAPVAVLRFFFGAEFGESLANLRKVKQRIVAEAIASARRIENYSFRLPAKGSQRFSVASGSEHAYESSGTLRWRNIF